MSAVDDHSDDHADDHRAFAALVERHRRELQVHCYRMTGSYDRAEDLVQDTFERAWRARRQFEGRSSPRTWLYRIATNASLDLLKRSDRRTAPVGAIDDALETGGVQPYPDSRLAPDDVADRVAAGETIELALIAALLHLPPRQRAAFIARDVLGLSAADTGAVLGVSETTANSLVQRARAELRRRSPSTRVDWRRDDVPERHRDLLRRYVAAHERGDADAIIALLRADVRVTMPPEPPCVGLDAAAAFFRSILAGPTGYDWRLVETKANGQPAFANYTRGDDGVFRAVSIDVLTVVGGQIAAIDCFLDTVSFEHFALPSELPSG